MKGSFVIVTVLLAALPGGLFAQRQFDSAEAAAEALINAAANSDTAQLDAIFGPSGKRVLTSGDSKQDEAERSEFAGISREKHEVKVDSRNPNRAILLVGSDDWPFPVPMARKNRRWSFDAADGDLEVQARRVGANELDVIEICAGYVEAQKDYSEQSRANGGMAAYARRISRSAAGQHDGLYWDGGGAVPERFAEAAWESHGSAPPKPKPYHGYYFRILESQGPNAPGGQHNYVVKNALIGGFGLVAWPADYGVTGIHSFIVNQDGVVYQKDFGPKPGNVASPVTQYDPDPTWRPVE
jgi:hypothetical protein